MTSDLLVFRDGEGWTQDGEQVFDPEQVYGK